MNLIVVLICLGLERYLNIGVFLNRFKFSQLFVSYISLLKSYLKNESFWKSWVGLALIVLPPVIVLSILSCLLMRPMHGLLYIVLNVVVLLFCFGPDDLFYHIKNYFQFKETDPKAADEELAAILGSVIPADRSTVNRSLTKALFLRANTGIFSVLFWFILAGPAGALLYRLITLLYPYAVQNNMTVARPAELVQQILEWIPIRITALIYALVGNFMPSFQCWLKKIWSGLSGNAVILNECGLAALGADVQDEADADMDENRETAALIDRALIVAVVLIALSTLSSLVY
ncbi:MAG: regulatory signaling modulator protein AmpE [Proteobacteria bacterium]|nr:regulatory signaling modulator protein AmpE [Pseudomonadota bacterium]